MEKVKNVGGNIKQDLLRKLILMFKSRHKAERKREIKIAELVQEDNNSSRWWLLLFSFSPKKLFKKKTLFHFTLTVEPRLSKMIKKRLHFSSVLFCSLLISKSKKLQFFFWSGQATKSWQIVFLSFFVSTLTGRFCLTLTKKKI